MRSRQCALSVWDVPKPTLRRDLDRQLGLVQALIARCIGIVLFELVEQKYPGGRRKMGRMKRRGKRGQFMQLPYALLDTADYLSLSPSSKQLLIDVFRQYNGHNNGDLSASFTLLQRRGWKSKGTLKRALDQLISRDLLVKTREGWFQGEHSSQCALYAVTWLGIDECRGKNLEVQPNPRPRRKLIDEVQSVSSPGLVPGSVQKQGRECHRDAMGRFIPAPN